CVYFPQPALYVAECQSETHEECPLLKAAQKTQVLQYDALHCLMLLVKNLCAFHNRRDLDSFFLEHVLLSFGTHLNQVMIHSRALQCSQMAGTNWYKCCKSLQNFCYPPHHNKTLSLAPS